MTDLDEQRDGSGKLLVVVDDIGMLAEIIDATTRVPDTLVTCASSGAEAMDLDCLQHHDLAIIGEPLSDLCGLDLARNLLALRGRPIILVGRRPSAEDLIHALRLGVADYVTTPLDGDYFRETVERALECERAVQRDLRRHHRHRALLRRVLRDRRNLSQRIDLICRDLVGAQRRLFHRVLHSEHSRPPSP